MKPKKNTKREKVILNSDAGDEPCICSHPRRSHLGDEGHLCFGCYGENTKSKFVHPFKMDNLTYIEKLYNRKELEKYKKLERLKNDNRFI
jgi:hypothetical protein